MKVRCGCCGRYDRLAKLKQTFGGLVCRDTSSCLRRAKRMRVRAAR